MKFQAFKIFIFLIHIDFGISASPEKLSKAENEHRLKTCGTEPTPTPSTNETAVVLTTSIPWFWISHSTFPRAPNETWYSAASRISTRHFLTFSKTILTDKMEWRHNGSKFEPQCTKGKQHAEVPPSVLSHVKFTSMNCYNFNNSKCSKFQLTPVRAYLLHICDSNVRRYFEYLFSPLIVETEEPYNGPVPCLPNAETPHSPEDKADVYRLSLDTGLKRSRVTLKNIGRMALEKRPAGGVIVRIIDRKSTLVGCTAGPGRLTVGLRNAFFNLGWLEKGICELTGVCSPTIPTTPSTPRATTTSEAPSSTLKTATSSEAMKTSASTMMSSPETSSFRTAEVGTSPLTTTATPAVTNTTEGVTTSESITTLESTTSTPIYFVSSELTTILETTRVPEIVRAPESATTSESTSSTPWPTTVSEMLKTSVESTKAITTSPTLYASSESPKRIQKTSTPVDQKEEEYDYEEYAEGPPSSPLETDESLDDDVESGGEGRKIPELSFLIFVWFLLG